MATISKRRGRWILDYYDQQGKRHWETMPKNETKKLAREKLREIEDQVERGTFIANKKIPAFEKVINDWLDWNIN